MGFFDLLLGLIYDPMRAVALACSAFDWHQVQSWLRISCDLSVSIVLDRGHDLAMRWKGQTMSLTLSRLISCVAVKTRGLVLTGHWMVKAHVGSVWPECSWNTNLDAEAVVSRYGQHLVISSYGLAPEVAAEHSLLRSPHVLLLADLCCCACYV